jgi:hypothetical protein
MGLFVGDRPVFDASRHDQAFPFLQPDVAIPKFHSKSALYDKEQLVFVVVVVPDERSLELDQFDLLAVQFADDFGFPQVGE